MATSYCTGPLTVMSSTGCILMYHCAPYTDTGTPTVIGTRFGIICITNMFAASRTTNNGVGVHILLEVASDRTPY